MLSRVTVFVFAMSILVGTALAAEQSSLYLSRYRAWLTPESGGVIDVTIEVQAVDYMDDVGALYVEIWESQDGGANWDCVTTYYNSMYPELLVQNDVLYYDTPISYEGTAGYKYYAQVCVYAGDSTGSDSRVYVTPTVVARR